MSVIDVIRRRLGLTVWLACMGVAASSASADQTDPRLSHLFSSLVNAANPGIAQSIQQEIWAIWFEGPDNQSVDALINARMAAEAGDVEAAGRAFDRLVEDYPGFAEAWNQRAILRYLVGNITGSLSDIDQALALEPRHFGALSGRGQCYLRMENYRAALNSFEEALGINPWIQSTALQIQMLKAILSQQQPI
tara:strand:- start:197 stop:775 length:579 start_codon:yes stop_codon:yes gene_type:complete